MKKKYGVDWKWNKDFIYTANIVTYKQDSLEVDYEAYRKLVRYFLQPKFVDPGGAIIVHPAAGEIFYLTFEEKRRLIQVTLDEVNGKVPVFSGCFQMTTEDYVKDAVMAKDEGVDGIFYLPPLGSGDISHGWNPDRYPEYWINHMRAITDATNLPMIVHPTAQHTPRWGIGLPVSATIKVLQAVPHIVGWKMTYNYPGWKTVTEEIRKLDHHVGILAAAGDLYHWALLNEYFDGSVNGAWCYGMEAMMDHIVAWKNNDLAEARRIWNGGLRELQDYVYSDYSRFHGRYKIGAWLRGLTPHPFMRPPQPDPMVEEIRIMARLIAKCGMNVISDSEIEKMIAKLKPQQSASAATR